MLPIATPALVVLLAALIVVFGALVPLFEDTYLQQQRDLCRHLVESVVSDLAHRERAVAAGDVEGETARRRALTRVRNLRHGPADRDYFWIVGPDGRFLVHPYRPDLVGRDPREVRGPDGAPLRELIAVMEHAVGPQGDGFLTYVWHWQDDLDVLVEKISYVERFEPWGWIVGTGVYPEDMARDLASLRRQLATAGVLLGLLASGLALLLSFRMLRSQAQEEEAQVRLATSEENLRITLESIGDGVIATDIDGRIREMNVVAERLTGHARATVVGCPLADVFRLVDPVTHAPLPGPVAQVVQHEEAVDLPSETLLMARDGELRRIADSAAPIRAGAGAVVGVVLVFRDVTEEYELQERLRQSQKMEVVGQLAGGVAHDFNNMLAAIMGSAELLDLELPPTSSLRAHVATIMSGARNAADLTQKLLTFSRKGRLTLAPIDLHEIVAAAIGLLRRSLDRSIRIETRLTATMPRAIGDAAQLQNILLNLALNARDAMPDGGTLTFASTDRDQAPIAGSNGITGSDGWIEIVVADTGVGMPPEVRERVLEPFYTTKAVGEGTGLGLSTVYGAVREHGGEVRIDSEPGEGTAVSILLPRADHAAAEPALAPLPTARCENLRVLVTDDEPLVRATAAAQLRALGCRVSEAADGAEAIAMVARDPAAVDVVLLDMVMPGLDGRATFLRLRELRGDLPVILSSGHAPERVVDDLLACERVTFVAKPYRRHALAEAVASAMG